jgi:electron-transferring-flavoprotein dehydrogenase
VDATGAGPASLAGALHLSRLAKAADRELEVLVIEKGGEIGNHGISGAVVDPRGFDELLPDWRESAPVESPVTTDELWYLTERGKIKAPFTPPPLRNEGKYVASLQKLSKWLGERAEEEGAQVFPAFSARARGARSPSRRSRDSISVPDASRKCTPPG